MSKFIEWCEKELELIGGSDDEMQCLINKNILDICKLFDSQGHSGFSASYVIHKIARLLDWKPITPLIGDDDEWNLIDENVYQNKRCSAVFKEGKNGKAYYIHGKIFSDDGGETWFSNQNSWVYIDFPYVVPLESERIILNMQNS